MPFASARDRRRSAHPLTDIEVSFGAASLDGRQPAVADQRRRRGRDVAPEDSRQLDDREPDQRLARTEAHAGESAGADGRERDQRPQGGQRDQHALGVLRPDRRDQHQAGEDRADDRADGVGRVDATDHRAAILAL